MPQPLSQVAPGAAYAIGLAGVDPTLAAKVLSTISSWSESDLFLGTLLAAFMRSDYRAVSAMYSSVNSAPARHAMLLEAAGEVAPENKVLIQACFRASSSSLRTRHKFAHHLWGSVLGLPSSLLLVDPVAYYKYDAAMRDYASNFVPDVSDGFIRADLRGWPAPDRSKMMVYSSEEIDKIVAEAAEWVSRFRLLHSSCSLTSPDDAARRQLVGVPEIAAALDWLKDRQQTL